MSNESDDRAAMAAINHFDKREQIRIADPLPRTTISGLDRLTFLSVSLTRPGGEGPFHLERLGSLREVHLR
jgi:hypothetical protein